MRKTCRQIVLFFLVPFVLLAACSSGEITEEDILEAVRLSEEQNPVADRPSAERNSVAIRANLCEITDPDVLDDGLKRRVWISIENSQPEIMSIVADISFTDGTVLRSDQVDVGAMFDSDPGSNSFGTYDTVDQDPSREGVDCFDEIESIAIVEFGEPVWMTAEIDRENRQAIEDAVNN